MASLLIRADASIAMGSGHVMRCLALAQAWQDAGGRPVFLMAEAPEAVKERLGAERCEVECISAQPGSEGDSRETIRIARQQNADWVAVDGYQFGADYQRELTAAGFKVLFLDDYGHAQRYFADIVLNQNIGVDEALYQNRQPNSRLLLGSRYCMLRREFASWREWKRDVRKVGRNVLVTMGGSDPENLTGRVVEALSLVKQQDLVAMVVVGGGNPHLESLQSAAGQGRTALRTNVWNMAELMAEADAAISAAGSTCWELCLMRLPALLIDVAENQERVARELDRRGCAIHLGDVKSVSVQKVANQLQRLLDSQDLRRELSQRSRELVDGGGAWRVASILQGASGLCVRDLRMRPACQGDARMLWEWANDPEVRRAAFSPAPISWPQHEVWFATKMKNPDCRILVAEDEQGRAVGQFRVDWESAQDGEIDVSVASEFRTAGWGRALIGLGARSVFAEKGERLHAFIKTENSASQRAFEQAGFTSLGEESVQGQRAIHYLRTRERDQSQRSE